MVDGLLIVVQRERPKQMWIWVVSNIAGSLLGAASTAWIKDTKVGVWGYSKFEDIADWAKDRYGIDILDKEDIAWKTKYPNRHIL